MPGVIAGQIGSNQFTVFELAVANKSPVIVSMKRPGTDYHAFKEMGLEYPEQELQTQQQFTDHATALAVAATYNNYIGTNQTLVRGGQTYGTYKFLKPPGSDYPRMGMPHFSRFVGDPGGLTSGFIVECEFLVQRQS